MHLVMSRVTEDDFDELLEVQFRAFECVPMHEAIFGPNTPENRARVKAQFVQGMKEDSADCWMKLVDRDSGKIVSGSQWKIYPSWAPLEMHEFHADFLPDKEEREMAEYLVNDFMQRRARYMYHHPHVLLYILFTDPNFQRCGAGSIQVKWGTDLADRLLVPAWVEASPFGHHLYEENGFRDVEKVSVPTKKWVSEYTMMRREPKTTLEAGRAILLN